MLWKRGSKGIYKLNPSNLPFQREGFLDPMFKPKSYFIEKIEQMVGSFFAISHRSSQIKRFGHNNAHIHKNQITLISYMHATPLTALLLIFVL
jgi:hypothetical protein